MKTIFISLFEGEEAKNILRTDIISTLLTDPEVKIVFLMKSKERVALYQAEFNDPRITYEVVPYVRSRGRGFDRLFGALKYTLLRTKSTILQRKLAREEKRNHTISFFGEFANAVLARPPVRRVVRALDFFLVRDSQYASLFDTYKPDLVFLAHLFEEPEIHILREAKRRKIKTIGFINSWDKVTERCIMRLLPDRAVVFNDIIRDDVVKHNDMPRERIFVAGLPHYDHYFRKSGSSREEFLARIKADPTRRLLVYATNIPLYSESDWKTIDLLHRLNERGAFGEPLNILVRFRPSDPLDQEEVAKRSHVHSDYPGIRFSSEQGRDWDMDGKDLAHLKDTLHWMDLLVCYSSSLAVDAVIFDKPIININFDAGARVNTRKPPVQFYNYTKEHYAKALASGGIRMVHSEGELVEWVRRYLKDSRIDQEGRERLAREQCQFFDGGSGVRIGKFIRANLLNQE